MKAAPASAPAAADRIGLGIGSMVAAVSLFSIADAAAKWLGQAYEPVQIVFFQALFGMIPIAVFVWRSGGLSSLRTRRPFAHVLRGILLFAAVLLFFTALRGLPLAEAIAVTFTAPLFITALSGPLLGEAVGVRRWAAVVIGFLGALIMVRPGTEAFRPEALLVMTSALMFALAMLLTRRLTRSETSVALVTYTTVITGLASLPLAVLAWQAPPAGDLGLFALVGIGGGSGAYLLIVAFRNAPAAVVAPFDFTKLIWASVFGWMLWAGNTRAGGVDRRRHRRGGGRLHHTPRNGARPECARDGPLISMTSDIDRAAKLMLDRYGRGATDEARRRAHDLAAMGDIAGAATWRRIGAAVEELPQVKPAGAAPLH